MTVKSELFEVVTGVGTSAVMYINKTEKHSLHYYLGPLSDHTVYKGEIVGLILALHLLKSIHFQLLSYTMIGTPFTNPKQYISTMPKQPLISRKYGKPAGNPPPDI